MAPELLRLRRVASTMDRLHQLAAGGAPAGTAVVAEEQTGGRGSRGRPWHSPRGGLWLSVLLRPASAAGVELLSLRLGLRVAEALEEALGEAAGVRLGLKWPNDLMLGERKAGGILCEARWQGESLGWVAAGVGLNVANPIPADLRGAAVALADASPGATADALLPAVLERLRQPVESVDRLTAAELAQLAGRDWLRGRLLRGPVAGRAEGVAPDGTLLVRTAEGVLAAVRDRGVELAGVPSTR